MRVLLDENLHRKLKLSFAEGVEVMTVTERGWRGRRNGDLLRAAQKEFDVFVTMDKGIGHQQNFSSLDLGIVVLRALSNRYEDTEPLMPEVCAALQTLCSGQLVTVGSMSRYARALCWPISGSSEILQTSVSRTAF
jgi:hypothetical protein